MNANTLWLGMGWTMLHFLWIAEQFEMVLLHELAHVRRWDNLVNLIQRLVESALFFHPAVWIVSGWVRKEREHCCDEIVVRQTGKARAYVETLLTLSTSVAAPVPRIAMAMARGHLVARVSDASSNLVRITIP